MSAVKKKYNSALLIVLYVYYSMAIPMYHHHSSTQILSGIEINIGNISLSSVKTNVTPAKLKVVPVPCFSKLCNICQDYCHFFINNYSDIVVVPLSILGNKNSCPNYSFINSVINSASNKGPPSTLTI